MLAMTMFVRDAEDLIRTNLEHHLQQGIDHVFVADNGSVDGTRDLLMEYQRAGAVTCFSEPEHRVQQGEVVTRLAAAAIERGASWLLHDDADEFWCAASGTVRTALLHRADGADVVRVQRYNLVPRPDDGRPWYERMDVRLRRPVHLPGYGTGRLGPKLAHRALPGTRVLQGAHEVEHPQLGDPVDDPSLRIVHAPVRDTHRFTASVIQHGEAYARSDLPPAVGHVRRDLYASYLDGSLPDRIAQMVFDEARVDDGLADGTLGVETAVRDAFRRFPPPQRRGTRIHHVL